MQIDLTIWIGFNLFLLMMLAVDLFFHRNVHVIKYKEAIGWSVIWITLALAFCYGIYLTLGSASALTFLTGYLIEKSLSVDNLFVFLMLFSYFAVPEKYLHKVLFWGVLGALVMRILFIFGGIYIISTFHWAIYLFGALLIFTGIKLGIGPSTEIDPKKNLVLQLFRKMVPVTDNYEGGKFFVLKEGKYWATPLFIALLAIETTDIFFAIDSVPAVLAITQDPFIAYTSNAFAILGLRSLYFVLAHFLKMFRFFNYGLCALLVFIGVKMVISQYLIIPTGIALGVIAIILTTTIVASLLIPEKKGL